MGRTILITGGSRSGKSGYAQRLAEAVSGRRVYIATCPVTDDEIRARIDRHRSDRAGGGWETVEEQLDLAGAVRAAGDADVVLVDCLTLWINNLMWDSEKRGERIGEGEVERLAGGVLEACREARASVIFVTNEVGMGIVPGDETTRLFRDLAGRCNQAFGSGADSVSLVVCGSALLIKGESGL